MVALFLLRLFGFVGDLLLVIIRFFRLICLVFLYLLGAVVVSFCSMLLRVVVVFGYWFVV